jgi:hypothetical protein
MFQTIKVFGQKILYGFGFGSGMGVAYSNQNLFKIDLSRVISNRSEFYSNEFDMDLGITGVDNKISKK